jgi:hypothetical protein
MSKPPRALPLEPLVGNEWKPVWQTRPGSYEALSGKIDGIPIPHTMPVWSLINSRNADLWRPCYATRAQLGATLALSERTITRHLSVLRKVGLLFEVPRGVEPKTRRNRPPARWALDPFKIARWRPAQDPEKKPSPLETAIARMAEEDGRSTAFVRGTIRELDKFAQRSEHLGMLIQRDMPTSRRTLGRKPRKSSRSKKKQRRSPLLAPGANLAHEGSGFTTTETGGEKSVDGGGGDGAVRSRPKDGRMSTTLSEKREEKSGPPAASANRLTDGAGKPYGDTLQLWPAETVASHHEEAA